MIGEIRGLMEDNDHISTDALEKFLKAKVIDFYGRVEFNYERIVNPFTELVDKNIIIGADGAKSIVRRKIFCEDMEVRENLQKIMMVKFFIKEPRNAEGYLRRLYNMAASRVIHDVRYGIANEGRGIPVTLSIIPTKAIQRIMAPFNPEALHSRPWDAYAGNVPNELLVLVTRTLALRGINQAELGAIDIKFVELNNYVAKNFAKCNNATWLLVGDAASGVPFFRSLNKGLKEGLFLSNEIRKFMAGHIYNFENYNKFMKQNSYNEVKRARRYSLAVDARRKYLTWTGGGKFEMCLINWAIVVVILLLIILVVCLFVSRKDVANLVDVGSHLCQGFIS